MHSIRRRLLFVLAIGFAVLIAGTGFYLDRLLAKRVTEEFDAALQSKADALVALTEQEAGKIEFDYDGWPEFTRAECPDYFEIWLDDGTALFRSERLSGDLQGDPAHEPAIRDVTLPDGRPGRAVQRAFVPRGPADKGDEAEDSAAAAVPPASHAVVLVVARGRERLDLLLARMRWTLLGFGGALTLLAVLLVWRALVTGLRPIDVIASQVRGLDARNLGTRIPPRTARELKPVVDQLNALLARLEESFERERRFAANVAHELKTPIAELRSLAEVASAWPDDTESVARFFGDVRDIATNMERLVADLLLLARCQAGVEAAEHRPLGLKELVETAWSRLAAAASRKGLLFRLEMPEEIVLRSEPEKLRIILGNLLDNAVSYALPGGEIRCSGTLSRSAFRLEISNPALPLSREDLARLTEPFWRKDEARSPDGHAGLGLSLVSALAKRLDLDASFDQDPDGTFRVRLEGRHETVRLATGSQGAATTLSSS